MSHTYCLKILTHIQDQWTIAQLCIMSRCWPCLILWLTHQPGMSHFQQIVDGWCAYHRLPVNLDLVTMGWKGLRISWNATDAPWSAHQWNCVSFQSWLEQFEVSEKNLKLTQMCKFVNHHCHDPFIPPHHIDSSTWHIVASHSLDLPLLIFISGLRLLSYLTISHSTTMY